MSSLLTHIYVLDELNKIICSSAENVWNITLWHLVGGKLAWTNLGQGHNPGATIKMTTRLSVA